MRRLLLATISATIVGLCAYLQADTPPKDADAIPLGVRLVDADTGKDVGGIVRVFRAGEDKPLPLPGLYDRMRGLPKQPVGWHVVPKSVGTTYLPRGKYRIEAISGLETGLTKQEIDLDRPPAAPVTLKLKAVFRPEATDLVAGNTHLHLMNLTAEDAEAYLRQVPSADRLRVLFLSYLERVKDDATYITNRYPIGDLKDFAASGVLVNNGEEHRHNIGSHGQGYGHVMFLNIKNLIKPVSLGAGITGAGNDDRPLQPGIEDARKQGGTVIWCHNTFGFEDVPNVLAGRVDALNVFDGARSGTYEEGYYRYLNVGRRLPISTGTDWFLYDFARVYAKVPGKLTVPAWLDALKVGRCQVTNGPLLTLTVDGKEIGDVLALDAAKVVRVELAATGRHDFQKLQLVQGGRVVESADAKVKDGVWTARIRREVRVEVPTWFAGRIDATTRNELDRQLYAHTSPVYVDFGGQRVFDVEAARALQKQTEEARDELRARGTFGTDAARDDILAIYAEAARDLTQQINRRAK